MTEIFLTQQTGEVLHRPAAPGLRLTQTTAEVLRRPARQIMDKVLDVLESTTPELVAMSSSTLWKWCAVMVGHGPCCFTTSSRRRC